MINYLPILTIFRGFAAWWVVVYHFREALRLEEGNFFLWVFERGFLAVDFFFVLSGFVVFINYSNFFKSNICNNFYVFLIKRFARVYPLHIFMMIVFVANPIAIILFSSARDLGDRYDLVYFVASVFLVQNWGGFDQLAWNVPAWSISVEFFSYLVFPFFCYFCCRFVRSSVAFGFLFFSLFSGLAVIYFCAGVSSIGADITGLAIWRCVFEFMIGVLVGKVWLDFGKERVLLVCVVPICFGLVFALYFLGFPDYFHVPLMFALLIYFGSTSSLWKGKYPQFLIYLGEISYSTYMVHFFVKDWVKFLTKSIGVDTFLIYVVIVLVSSMLLYRFVEIPGKKIVLGLLGRYD